MYYRQVARIKRCLSCRYLTKPSIIPLSDNEAHYGCVYTVGTLPPLPIPRVLTPLPAAARRVRYRSVSSHIRTRASLRLPHETRSQGASILLISYVLANH